MKVAVVILNWNGRDLLKKFLPSVIQNSHNASIYVADNASTDDSIMILKTTFPEVKIIENPVNAGYAGGYNLALRSVPEEIQILLNSDVEVTKDWLGPIVEVFEREPRTAAVQPKILDYYNRKNFEYAGAAGGFIDKYAYPYCRGRIFQRLEEDHAQYNDDCDIFWASGACLAIQKKAFDEVGGFDEDFFAHQEEIDLCWRFHKKAYKVKFAAKSRVYHVGGATLQNMNPKKTFFNFRNSLFLILKNIDGPKVYYILLVRMLLDGIAGFKFLIEGKFNHFFSILEAHGSFYRHFRMFKKKRKKPGIKFRYYQVESVVYQHFLLGKKKFSELRE